MAGFVRLVDDLWSMKKERRKEGKKGEGSKMLWASMYSMGKKR